VSGSQRKLQVTIYVVRSLELFICEYICEWLIGRHCRVI